MKKYIPIICISVIFFTISCKPEKQISETPKSKTTEQENFIAFLPNFIGDSIFRYSRINFPITGYNSDADDKKDNYKWTKEEWDYYFQEDYNHTDNPNIVTSTYMTDTLSSWRLYIKNSGYDIRYYFKAKNGKWYLKSYSYKNY